MNHFSFAQWRKRNTWERNDICGEEVQQHRSTGEVTAHHHKIYYTTTFHNISQLQAGWFWRVLVCFIMVPLLAFCLRIY